MCARNCTAGRKPAQGGIRSGLPAGESDSLITELRETIAKLRESERQLRLVIDNAPVAIARIDTEARYTFVNRNLAERQGLISEQIIGYPSK